MVLSRYCKKSNEFNQYYGWVIVIFYNYGNREPY